MPRRCLVSALAALCCVAAALTATTASASPEVRFGIQDDAWLEHGPGTLAQRIDELDRLGVDLVRVTLDWSAIEATRGELDWTRADELLEGLRDGGIAPLVTLWGTPSWANGGRGPNWAPTRAADFASFVGAAADRYGFVRQWLIWNEPNNGRWLRPVSPLTYTTKLLNPGYRAIKSAIPGARVGGGVTAPRGGSGGMSPVDFIRGMSRAGARLDAVAHHPYPRSPSDTPYSGGCAHCKTITMSTLERLVREVGRGFPRARIWLTEYGYQTNPPDRFLGVSPAKQAQYVSAAALRVYSAPKVDMLVQYLYRDEPELGAWQSGLRTVRGRAKPSLLATMLPLEQVSRNHDVTVVWGQVRPGKGRQRYVLQQRNGTRWRSVGGVRETSPRGYLRRTLRAPKGAKLRIWYPADRIASAVLVIR
jgi:hypothetical protein